jgi:hypothetical protein
VSVYTVPSLVVYTGTQNRPRIEWRSKGNDQIIHAMCVSTNTVVAEPDSLTMLAYQRSRVSFTPPPQSSQPAIQRSVLVLSFRPRPNWCVQQAFYNTSSLFLKRTHISAGCRNNNGLNTHVPQANTYLSWLPQQQWIKYTCSSSEHMSQLVATTTMD